MVAAVAHTATYTSTVKMENTMESLPHRFLPLLALVGIQERGITNEHYEDDDSSLSLGYYRFQRFEGS
jgi:hypothetical protein